ncbi:ATP-binding protein [Nocardiopsis coralliicola]
MLDPVLNESWLAALLPEAEQAAHLHLSANVSASALARSWIETAALMGDGDRELVDDLRLAASELVANACLHTRPGTLTLVLLRAPGAALLAVTDPGSVRGTTPHLRLADADEEGGRGLHIVAALSKRWGVAVAASGSTTVWAHLVEGAQHVTNQGRGDGARAAAA